MFNDIGNYCSKKHGYCQCLQYTQERIPPTCTAIYCPLRDKEEDRDKLIKEYNKKRND